jgi:predicted transcriptional regulator
LAKPKLTKLELQVLEALWEKGPCSVREILDTFPLSGKPAYTTVQTVVYLVESGEFNTGRHRRSG